MDVPAETTHLASGVVDSGMCSSGEGGGVANQLLGTRYNSAS